MPQDILDAFSQRFARKDALDVIGRIFSTPQHLLTAAFDPNRDYLSSFAKGVDPSELAGVGGVGGFALDVLADPLNLLVGAGLITKLARTGKFVKAARAVNPLDDLARETTRTLRQPLDQYGGASKLLENPLFRAHVVLDQEAAAALRGGKFPLKEISEAIARMPDDDLLKIMAKGTAEGVENLDMFERLAYTTGIFKFEKGNMIDDFLKGVQNEDLLRLGGAARRAGQEFRVQREVVDIARTNFARMLRDETNPAKRDAIKAMADALGITKKEVDPTFFQKFVEYSVMAKLTGLSTHVRALMGNSTNTIIRIPEKFAAGAIDALVHGVGKGPRSVYATEALAGSIGMLKSMKNGINRAWAMIVSPTKYFEEATKAKEIMFRGGAIGGKLGEFVRFPARIIGAVDVFFKELNKGAEIYEQATRMALKEGKSKTGLIKRVQEILENPTPEMLKKASLSAKERVFQEELTGIIKTLDNFRGKHPGSRLIVPFFRTPVNLLKQSVQRTPLTFALPSTWKTLKGTSQAAKMELMGRALTGSIFLGGLTMYAMESGGISSLGPKAKSKRSILRLVGWQPQSVRVKIDGKDSWISYRGFEPLSSWLRVAADIAEGVKGEESIISLAPKMVASFAKQFAENPFFMGVHDLFESFSDPEAKADKIFAGLAIGSTVPNILQQWGTRVYDPVVREPKDLGDRLLVRLPFGISKAVKPLRNIYGEPIERDIPALTALGFGISLEKGGKLEREMVRLQMGVGKPSKVVNGYEMNDEEYDRYFVLKGAMLKETLDRIANSPGYDRMTDETKIKVLRRTISKVNSFTKHQEFEKYYRSTL